MPEDIYSVFSCILLSISKKYSLSDIYRWLIVWRHIIRLQYRDNATS
ncbi:hypothetical protein SENTW_3224 [Salmonella enterica subsp. enterica serovar Weltevreden str. 2007-60-3289-1]|nr:conserved hypothetical protein [Salmonella enterica subsp. enterica serovar Weltevreden str. HI_N05-537]CBY97305.1 hypothetical protein SENTW_3224 [Salmonella enterica subsp. enterica serovar Weltevreden str. 2007-60-3289-1]VUG01125.1 hypothetical protein UPM260_2925 [Salmonella enterica subsp. enterica serovar Typhimurium]